MKRDASTSSNRDGLRRKVLTKQHKKLKSPMFRPDNQPMTSQDTGGTTAPRESGGSTKSSPVLDIEMMEILGLSEEEMAEQITMHADIERQKHATQVRCEEDSKALDYGITGWMLADKGRTLHYRVSHPSNDEVRYLEAQKMAGMEWTKNMEYF